MNLFDREVRLLASLFRLNFASVNSIDIRLQSPLAKSGPRETGGKKSGLMKQYLRTKRVKGFSGIRN